MSFRLYENDLFIRSKSTGELVPIGMVSKDGAAFDNAVAAWLAAHPEATTTVQDGSITEEKIQPSFLKSIKNSYVTPEMFGAVGDGLHDDTDSLVAAFNAGRYIVLTSKYRIRAGSIIVSNDTKCVGIGSVIVVDAYEAVSPDYNTASAITVKNGAYFDISGVSFKSVQTFTPNENLKASLSLDSVYASNIAFVSGNNGHTFISNCQFDSGTIGKYVGLSSVTIKNSKLTNGEHGLYVSDGATINIDGLDMEMSNSMGGTLYHALYCAPCGESIIRELHVKSSRNGTELKFNNNSTYSDIARKVTFVNSSFDTVASEGLFNLNCNALNLNMCAIKCVRLGRTSDVGSATIDKCDVYFNSGTDNLPVCVPVNFSLSDCNVTKTGSRRFTEVGNYFNNCNFIFFEASSQDIGYSSSAVAGHIIFKNCSFSVTDMSDSNKYKLNAARIETRYLGCSFNGSNMESGWKCTYGKLLLSNCYFNDCVPSISKLQDTTLIYDILGSDGNWHTTRT